MQYGITNKRRQDRRQIGPLVCSRPAAMLFGSAGTLRWPEAWLYLIIQEENRV
jgi:hypothetical protein